MSAGGDPGRACGCGGAPGLPSTLSDYIDRGFRRRRRPALGVAGGTWRDDAGRFAAFSLQLVDGVVQDVAFDATACVTLLAYCELAAEIVTGRAVGDAARHLRVNALQSALPQVPPGRRDRAALAAQALLATLVAAERRERA